MLFNRRVASFTYIIIIIIIIITHFIQTKLSPQLNITLHSTLKCAKMFLKCIKKYATSSNVNQLKSDKTVCD